MCLNNGKINFIKIKSNINLKMNNGKINFEDNITLPRYENISWECIDFYSINETLYIIMRKFNYSTINYANWYIDYLNQKPYLLIWRNKTIKIISNYSNPYYFVKVKGGVIPIEKSYIKNIFRYKYKNIRIMEGDFRRYSATR